MEYSLRPGALVLPLPVNYMGNELLSRVEFIVVPD